MDEMNFDNIGENIIGNTEQPSGEPAAENTLDNTSKIPRPANPRRRKKSQLQIFKESYLPLIIAGVALLLIVIFIIGSIVRAVKKHNVEKEASIAASSSLAAEQAALEAEAQQLLSIAAQQAAGYDFAGAIATIDSFSGDIAAYEELMTKRAEYTEAQRTLTAWTDPSDVTNLSFHPLVADPALAYADEEWSGSYEENFVTVTEFQNILQQLYDNGYMLVSLDDFITTTTLADGTVSYEAKTLYLPTGKKPLMITQTHCNYYTYMVDSDEDGFADAGGSGFASRLVVGSDGKLTNEMIDAQGNTVTGAYDLVPILDAFIETHPDFSFSGAKATLAFTGYDGIFGYRTSSSAKETLDEAAYNAELQGAATVINALRSSGYTFACYTYNNIGYGESTSDVIQEDLTNWANEVAPLVGSTDIMVYAQGSDIADSGAYSGELYEVLKAAGYKYFLGFCTDGNGWVFTDVGYARQGRIPVTGGNLINNPTWFAGMFDTDTVLDAARSSAAE